ncbi:(d)CMP kinase [Desulfurococcus amylolyticus]|uniref:Cytidylate kinase n=1 Tax=Desulfurococcus amylolyticus (strain DSM 18924 / JCM 16383 / VKM B-2413 / 1221n) TaxID=490899 RepID=KCY_DESA1|nr:AAA family ATPase [Desulfurococcus amylolyticus]B8D5U4.1 RecName: Full=Cytidylate kinase; Short=CK; AltName: Full=Cytidine monophosphate kinase; Short=CMP kinase [Desulfurococcus amylolyticus 1221n]ACL11475.1 cytidylate kinase [Desulfurococcus amylolyticus 1221n]
MVKIVFSGPPGSGKTTQAKRVAEYYGLKYFSAGSLFREYARRKGVSLEELSRIALEDPSIDLEIDRMTLETVRDSDDIVIDGHLAAWIVSDIVDLKIYVTAPLTLRILRVAGRDNTPLGKALAETLIREYSQRRRFMEYYGIDIYDTSIFDLTINTKLIGVEEAFNIIKSIIDKILKEKHGSMSE